MHPASHTLGGLKPSEVLNLQSQDELLMQMYVHATAALFALSCMMWILATCQPYQAFLCIHFVLPPLGMRRGRGGEKGGGGGLTYLPLALNPINSCMAVQVDA